MDSFLNIIVFTIIFILNSFPKTSANIPINYLKFYSSEVTAELAHIRETEQNKYFTL